MPRSSKNATLLIFILACLTMVGPLTIDLYLPAFPEIKQNFHTSDTMVQLTLAGTALGFAVGQLFVGPWSDTVGRRKPLLICSALHSVACLSAVIAPNIELLAVSRIVQGVAAASSMAVARAAVRDLFEGDELVKALARVALVMGIAPLAAPVIGSQLLRFTTWRGLFVFLAIFGLLMFLAVLFVLPETLAPERRKAAQRESKYATLLSDKKFMGIVLAGGFMTGVMFTYISSSSFVFQDIYGLNAQQFGYLFTAISLANLAGMQIGSRLIRRFSGVKVLIVATFVTLLGCIVILITDEINNSIFSIIIPLWLTILCLGMCFISVQVLSLANHANEAGTAAALMGASQFGVSAVATPIAGLFGLTSVKPMVFVMLGFATFALASIVFAVKPFSSDARRNSKRVE
ncbi:MAG: multidrug effflux MFS transporter [Micrococcaceae bacterium]